MKKYGLAVVLLGLLVALPGSLFASTGCATIDNVSGVDIEICYTTAILGGGPDYTLTVDTITGPTTVKSINSIGWNADVDFISGPAGETWNKIQTDQHIDGFNPNLWANQASATQDPTNGGVGAQWTFSGNPGTDLVFHVQYNQTCSAWVGARDNPGTSPLSSAGCGTEVPEPATLTLLGTGLLGIAGAVRRRRAKKS